MKKLNTYSIFRNSIPGVENIVTHVEKVTQGNILEYDTLPQIVGYRSQNLVSHLPDIWYVISLTLFSMIKE